MGEQLIFPPSCTNTKMLVGKLAEKEVVEDRSRLENDRLVEEKLLVSALECPVCLTLPHSAPVYTCRVGHSVCGRCWRSLLKQRCPVCLTEYNRSAGIIKLIVHGSRTLYISLFMTGKSYYKVNH